MKIVLCSDFKLCRKCIPSNTPKWKRQLCQRDVPLGSWVLGAPSRSRAEPTPTNIALQFLAAPSVLLFKRHSSPAGWDFVRPDFASGAIYCTFFEIACRGTCLWYVARTAGTRAWLQAPDTYTGQEGLHPHAAPHPHAALHPHAACTCCMTTK